MTVMSHGRTATHLRADAERNRRQILEAAGRAFAADGPEVPMESVAKAAGVGVGTLYRRFPDRRALLVAVVEDNLLSFIAKTDAARQEEPRAWDAIVRCMSHSRELTLTVRPERPLSPELAEALMDDPTLRGLRRTLVASLERLVVAAQEEGSMRTDVGTGDVAMLFALTRRGTHLTGEVEERASARILAVILDGLDARARGQLPGRPLTADDLARPTTQG